MKSDIAAVKKWVLSFAIMCTQKDVMRAPQNNFKQIKLTQWLAHVTSFPYFYITPLKDFVFSCVLVFFTLFSLATPLGHIGNKCPVLWVTPSPRSIAASDVILQSHLEMRAKDKEKTRGEAVSMQPDLKQTQPSSQSPQSPHSPKHKLEALSA